MNTMDAAVSHRVQQDDIRRLVGIFVAWKAALLLLAACCPGPGYDTSGHILLQRGESSNTNVVQQGALRLLRWDALYFVKSSQRGYVYEQEWAFSQTFSTLLGAIVSRVYTSDIGSLTPYVIAGACVSHIAHLLSVLVLYRLVYLVTPSGKNLNVPLLASILHILSPAGIFLSAPYAESLFSMLNFTGMLHYALARRTALDVGTWTKAQDAYMLSSGVLFASATLLRSNGLLSGLIYLYDVASVASRLLGSQLTRHDLRRALVTCVAGCILAAGFITPQVLAYQMYCHSQHDGSRRPWCEKIVPSIYTWVQEHYWNVGFLGYWTVSNLPLFFLAAPMIWTLFASSATVLQPLLRQFKMETFPTNPTTSGANGITKQGLCLFPQLAFPQLALALAATTNFHVQIINRVSSGYPIWYLVMATELSNESKRSSYYRRLFQWFLGYAIVQSVLYANFLPPA